MPDYIPENLTITGVTTTTISISWSDANDPGPAESFQVYRNGILIQNTGLATTYTDTGLSPNTLYAYQITAIHSFNVESDPSDSISATTDVVPSSDVTPAGPLAIAINGLRTLISNLSFFQTWIGAADASAALSSIFVGEVGYPIISVGIAAGIMTVATREPHQIEAGYTVTIEGAAIGSQSDVSIDGVHTVAGVSTTTLTITTGLSDAETVYPEHAFLFSGQRPFAIISEADDSVHSDVIGTGGTAVHAGALEILLEADVSTAYQNDPRNALYEARNAFGQFVQSLAETQGTGDLMCLNKIEPASSPQFTSKSEQDSNTKRFERWRALVRVTWGLEG